METKPDRRSSVKMERTPADVIITGLDFVRLEKGQSLASYDIMLGISVRKHKSKERNWPKERNRLVFR